MNENKKIDGFNPGLNGPKPERGGMLKGQAKARVKKNKASTTIEPREVRVASWAPSKEGAKLSQVHVVVRADKYSFVVRLKSRAVCDEMIRALVNHRDDVWGAEEESEYEDDDEAIRCMSHAIKAYKAQVAQVDTTTRIFLASIDYLAGNHGENEPDKATLTREIVMRIRHILDLETEVIDPALGTGAFLANPPYGERGE